MLLLIALLLAQVHHHEEQAEDSIDPPHQRLASGTAWQPDATPMRMLHVMAGEWMLMFHGAASLGWDWQNGPRGDRRGVSTNWLMGMAAHPLAGGTFTARTMLSLEPATIPGPGFPLLGQTGEFYDGVHLHDRQHPHDLFMEVAVDYRRPLSDSFGFELYGGPAGEPALGPVAFMHRVSASSDPFPPLGHHWLDSTHISFGVATAALYTKGLKLEASWFNGREPDQDRWDFDLRPFDSFSLRLAAAPDPHVVLQISYGHLASPEPPQANNAVLDESRVTASIQISLPHVDATLAWGRNLEILPLDALLAEARFDLDGANVPFLRLERVDKTAHDLVVAGVPQFQPYTLHEIVLGFVHRFLALGPVEASLGARGSLLFLPSELTALYGGAVQPGAFAYLLVQLKR